MKRKLSVCGETMSLRSRYLPGIYNFCKGSQRVSVPEQVALQHHLPEVERNQAACCEFLQILQHLPRSCHT